MSILIRGMEMPSRGCNNCPFVNRTSYGDVCPFINGFINKRVEFGGFPLSCPLIELPPHGRLIDADALKNSIANVKHIDNANPHIMTAWREINLAPTIIEAEERET